MLYNLFQARLALVRLVRSVRAGILVTNTITLPLGGLAALTVGIPHVWFLHEFGVEDHDLQFLFGHRLTLAAVCRLADVVLVNSETLRRFVVGRIPRATVRIARYAVEVPKSDVSVSEGEGVFKMVLVGFKSFGKGQIEAIRALEILASKGLEVCLELVGDSVPGYEEELRRVCDGMRVSDRVVFSPFSSDATMKMARANVVLMCSRSEAFGRVTVEAMKMGRPVIGARAGATPELVSHGWNGLLYEAGVVEELARCIEQIYWDRGLGSRMGDRGREWAWERFNLRSYGSALETVLAEAMERGRARAWPRRSASRM